jgi:hypothetical protein
MGASHWKLLSCVREQKGQALDGEKNGPRVAASYLQEEANREQLIGREEK